MEKEKIIMKKGTRRMKKEKIFLEKEQRKGIAFWRRKKGGGQRFWKESTSQMLNIGKISIIYR